MPIAGIVHKAEAQVKDTTAVRGRRKATISLPVGEVIWLCSYDVIHSTSAPKNANEIRSFPELC